MKDTRMESEYRVVQFFLPLELASNGRNAGVYEVSTNERRFRCNCHDYDAKGSCKHIAWVKQKIKENDGVAYPIEIENAGYDPETMARAQESSESFRRFLAKFGRIEVI